MGNDDTLNSVGIYSMLLQNWHKISIVKSTSLVGAMT